MLRIKEILREKGLTQIELAEKLNKTKQQINDIVSERVGVSLPMLQTIATALDVPVWQLFVNPVEVCKPKAVFAAFVHCKGENHTFDSFEALKAFVDSL